MSWNHRSGAKNSPKLDSSKTGSGEAGEPEPEGGEPGPEGGEPENGSSEESSKVLLVSECVCVYLNVTGFSHLLTSAEPVGFILVPLGSVFRDCRQEEPEVEEDPEG